MAKTKEPQISPELVNYLNEKFPLSKLIEVQTLEELKFSQGQISVLQFLNSIHERQKKDGNILNV